MSLTEGRSPPIDDPLVRLVGIAAFVVVALSAIDARADATCIALEAAWPKAPAKSGASMGMMITDELTEIGNEIGHHMNVLSKDVVSLSFDGRQKRLKAKVGLGDSQYASFSLATDIQFVGSTAKVKATIDFSIQGKRMKFDLPEFEMMPQSYQGDRVVVLLVPIIQRRW